MEFPKKSLMKQSRFLKIDYLKLVSLVVKFISKHLELCGYIRYDTKYEHFTCLGVEKLNKV